MSKAGILNAWYLLVNMHELTSLCILAWIAFEKKAVGVILLIYLNFHDLDFASRKTLCKVNLSGISLV